MELPTPSQLYEDALATSKLADERLESWIRAEYDGSLCGFTSLCEAEDYPDPQHRRFVKLPSVLAAFIKQLADTIQSSTDKLRAALAWHHSMPEMLARGHPHDRWLVELHKNGRKVPRGNPAWSAIMLQVLVCPSKAKK
ncbi:hypothetical protein PybrP1_005702 [[Pythium] brassicae (nom. inval.)]|nr:hypothetical protein PybrP1_005702 [[Pythium] brassicae (nom. inval.)]